MARDGTVIPCTMDGAAFWDYAVYDTFVRRRRWVSPCLFAAILTPFAAVCFALHQRRGAVLLGVVLLLVGLGLPTFYIGNYLLALRRHTKKMRPVCYTVRLDGSGVTVQREDRAETYPWESLHAACRLPRVICLYPTPQQGFLLSGAEEGRLDEGWNIIKNALPPEKLSDRRGAQPGRDTK